MDGSAIPSTSKEPPKEDPDESDASDESGPPVLQRVDSEYYAEEPDCDDIEPCPLSAEPSTSSVFRQNCWSNGDQVYSEDEEMKPSTSDGGLTDEKTQQCSYVLNSDSAIQCFTCILCQKICNDAFVVYCSYLHRFCKKCIVSRWEAGNHCCPRCGEEITIKPEQDETWNQLIDQLRLNTDIVLPKDINRTPETSDSESEVERLPEESEENFADRRKNYYRRKDIREIQKRLMLPSTNDNALAQMAVEDSGKYFFKPHQLINKQSTAQQSLRHLNYKNLECNRNHQFSQTDVNRTILGQDDKDLFKRWKHFNKVASGMKNVNAIVKHKRKTLLMDFAKKNGLRNYVDISTSDDDHDDTMVKPTIESIRQILLDRKATFQEVTVKPQTAVKTKIEDSESQPSTSRLDSSEQDMQDDMPDEDSSRGESRLNFTFELEERPRSARSEDERATREPTELESDAEVTRDGIYDNASASKCINDTPPKEKVKRVWNPYEEENEQMDQENISQTTEEVDDSKTVTMREYNEHMMEYIKSNNFGGTYNIEEDNQLSAKEKEDRINFLKEHNAKMLAIMRLEIEGEQTDTAPQRKESILLDLLEQPSIDNSTLIPIRLIRIFDQNSRVPRCDFRSLNIQVQANIRIGHLVEFMYTKIANHYMWKIESVKKYIEINLFEVKLSEEQDEDLDLKRCKEARSKKVRTIPRNILNRRKFFNSLTITGEPKPKKEMRFRIPAYRMNPHPFEKGFCLPSRNGLVAFGDEVQLLALDELGLEQYCPPAPQQSLPKTTADPSKGLEARPVKEPQLYRPLKPKPVAASSSVSQQMDIVSMDMDTTNIDNVVLSKKKRHSSGGANSTPSTASACSTPGSSVIRKRRRKKTDPETDDETEKEHYIPPHLHPDKSNPNFGSGQQPYIMPPVLNEEVPCSALSRAHHSTGSLPNAGAEQNHVDVSPSAPPVLQNDSSQPPVLTPMSSAPQQRPNESFSMAKLKPVTLPPGCSVRTMAQESGPRPLVDLCPDYSPIVNLWNRKGQAITKLPTTYKFRGTPSELTGEMTVREVAIKSVESLMEQVKDYRAPTYLHERIKLNQLIHNESPDDGKKTRRAKAAMPRPHKVRKLKISKKFFPCKSSRKTNMTAWETLFHQVKPLEEANDTNEDDIKFAVDNNNLLEEMTEVPPGTSSVDRSPNKLDPKPILSLEQRRKKARLLEQKEKTTRRKQKMHDRFKHLLKKDLAHVVRYKHFTRTYRKDSLQDLRQQKNNPAVETIQQLAVPEQYAMSASYSGSKAPNAADRFQYHLKPGQRILLPKVDSSGQGKHNTGAPGTSSSHSHNSALSRVIPKNIIPSQATPHNNNAQIVTRDIGTGHQQYLSITVAGEEQLIPIQQSQNGQQVITANLAEIVQQATTTGTISKRNVPLLFPKGHPLLPSPSGLPTTSLLPATVPNMSFTFNPQQRMINPNLFPRPMPNNGQPILLGRGPHPTSFIPVNPPQFQIHTIGTQNGPKQYVVTLTHEGKQFTPIPSIPKQFEVPTMQGTMKMMTLIINGKMTVMPIIENGPPMQISSAGSPLKLGPQMTIPPNLVQVATHPGQVVRLQPQLMPLGVGPRIFQPNTLVPIQQPGQAPQLQSAVRPGPDTEPYTGSPVPVLYEQGVSPEPRENPQEEIEHLSSASDVPPSLSPAVSVEEPETSQSDGHTRKKSTSADEPSTNKEKSLTRSESDSTDKRDEDNSNGAPTSTSSATKRKKGRPPKKFTGFYAVPKTAETSTNISEAASERGATSSRDNPETPVLKQNQLHPDLSPPENEEHILTAPTTFNIYETPNKRTASNSTFSPKAELTTPLSDKNKAVKESPQSLNKIEPIRLKRNLDKYPKYTPSRYPHGMRKKKKLRKTKKVYREPTADNARLVSLDGRYHRVLLKYPMQALSADVQIAELYEKVNLSSEDSFVLVFSIRSRNNNCS